MVRSGDLTLRGLLWRPFGQGPFPAVLYNHGSGPATERLLAAVRHARAPILFIHAANDYSVEPGKALSSEMRRLGTASRVIIYPPVGEGPSDGHDFIHRGLANWNEAVFAFLHDRMRS